MIDRRVRQFVRERAGDRCEYCQISQALSPVAQLQIEHIIPRKHGGSNEEQNLALACIDCNLAKSSNLTGIDPQSGEITSLFNPRVDQWSEHFVWRGVVLEGSTPVGRTTIRVLNINHEERLQVRIAASF